jgi:hypothetical protein
MYVLMGTVIKFEAHKGEEIFSYISYQELVMKAVRGCLFTPRTILSVLFWFAEKPFKPSK